MGTIRLKDIQIYAYHGCLIEEGKIGANYKVDLLIDADLSTSAVTDELHDTVDYVHLNKIIKEEMAIRSKLLEHVAKRILDRIFSELTMVNSASISVSKINPPIGGNVAEVAIEMDKTRKI